jgi:DNA repair exonuclease SbcCD ATPase subunit
MEINIQNFKGISSKRIQFNTGMTLLMGTSGAGKSSVVEAILFAITGKPKKNKPLGSNKKTKVELVLNNLKIIRTARSSSLVVKLRDKEYLDAAAEGVLKDEFGNFESCCYVPQDASQAFVNLSPNAKSLLLEERALGNLSKHFKNSVKERSKCFGEEELLLRGESKVREQTVQGWEQCIPLDPGAQPTERTWESLREERAIVSQSLRDQRLLKKDQEHATKKVEDAQRMIAEEQKRIDELKQTIPRHADEIVKYVEWAEENKQIEALQTNVTEVRKMYQNSLTEHGLSVENEKKEIESQLWVQWSASEVEVQISQTEDALDAAKTIQRLVGAMEANKLTTEESVTKRIENLNDEMATVAREYSSVKHQHVQEIADLEKTMCSYIECPTCSQTLRWNEVIQEATIATQREYEQRSDRGRTQRRIARLRAQIKSCENTHVENMAALAHSKECFVEVRNLIASHELELDVENLQQFLSALKTYKHENKARQKRLEVLHRKEMPASIRSLKRKKEKLEAQWRNTVPSEEKIARPQGKNLRAQSDTIKMARREIEVRTNAINSFRREMEKTVTRFKQKWGNDPDVGPPDQCIEKNETLLRKLASLMESKQQWETQNAKYKRYNDDVSSLDNTRKRTAAVSAKLSALGALKLMVQKAESVALLATLDSINSHAQEYLECFFPEEPIVATLESFSQAKTSKKIKPSINISINHRGEEIPYSCLSGGEKIRIVTAFNLALSELEPSPIILLDEVTANLDVELTENILECVKKNTHGKIVIVIAHQCITGLFDDVMEIKS